MYDELVKRLWECASGECFNCSQYTPTTNASVCQKELMKQAAEAIEERNREVERLRKVIMRLEDELGILDELPMVDQREPLKEG